MKLSNFLCGEWVEGAGEGIALHNPVTGDEVARVSSDGLDLDAALSYARMQGNSSLQAMNYAERAGLLKKISEVLSANRDRYYDIARINYGATKTDAAVDIDGAIFTLKFYARAASALGDATLLKEGSPVGLAKTEDFQGQHYLQPLSGVAVFINAFNFPSWGLWEKAAPAIVSGVPVVIKPATPTAWLTQIMVKDVIDAGILPKGALSVVCGSARELLNFVQAEDVVSFTGSAETAAMIKTHPAVVANSVRVNIEADSLNAAILGSDAIPGSDEFALAVREIVSELTTKAGQKCTAIRRIFVPSESIDALSDVLITKLGKISVGDPADEAIRMGPLVSVEQKDAALTALAQLQADSSSVFDQNSADVDQGAMLSPILLRNDHGLDAAATHDVEVFGPVATLIPYDTDDSLIAMIRRGKGSLVASLYSSDIDFITTIIPAIADLHGRLMVVDKTVGKQHTGHGNVMPSCMHGGPGRAGGGEELGGLRALTLYHRRYVVQSSPQVLAALNAKAVDINVLCQ